MVNHDIADRHEDAAESRDEGYREKAVMDEQQGGGGENFDNVNEKMIPDNVDVYEASNRVDSDGNAGVDKSGRYAGDPAEQNKPGDYRQGGGVEGDLDRNHDNVDRGDDDIDQEMAKLDMMERNRNAMAPSRDGEGSPGRDGEGTPGREGEGSPGREGEGSPGREGENGEDLLPPAIGEGDAVYDDQRQNEEEREEQNVEAREEDGFGEWRTAMSVMPRVSVSLV